MDARCYYAQGKKCSVLTRKHCEGCSFRKTYLEVVRDREKAKERIASLPLAQLIHIVDRYYSGKKCHTDIHDTDDFTL